MMKRSLSLLLVLILALTSFSLVASAASGASQVISQFNIMPQSCSADSENLVTRRDFAYTIANILGSGEAAPRATDFIDIGEDIEDSGYIYYATVNGFLATTGNMFCPDDPISLHDFNDAVIKLLAYETIAEANGGGKDGALKTVRDLKIYNGVTIKDYETVTVKQYRQLVYNLMTADITDFSYSYDQDGNINLYRTGTTKTLLSQYFGISRYYGSITEVNNQKPSAKFRVTKNVSEANPEMLVVGSDYYFLSNGTVDLNFYQNIPIEIWTNKDGVIVYIAPQPNVEVFYDVIYSVNNDTNPNNAYALNLVDEIEFNRDTREYKIDSSATVSYNGAITGIPVKLAGKYAKIVLINNKVTFIETWNLQEGGMVLEINNSYISYIKGEAEDKLKRIGEYDDIMVIIEGRSTDRNQIKPGSLFSYYQTDNLLVIVVSEKTLVGNFDSMSTGEIEIGRHFYPTSGNIYVSEDGENYHENDFDSVFDTQVTCYVDIFGNIRYMKSNGYLNEANVFTAYILGSSQKGFEDIKIKVQKIYPTLEEVIITKPSDLADSKYVAYDDTTASSLRDTFRSAQSIQQAALTTRQQDIERAADFLYKFTVDEDGVITQISEPDFFLLFGEEHYIPFTPEATDAVPAPTPTNVPIPRTPVKDAMLDHFCGDERAIYFPYTTDSESGYINGYNRNATDVASNWTYFWIRDEKFVVLTTIDGELGVVQRSHGDMVGLGTYTLSQGSSDGIVRIAMLAEPGASQPQCWFLYGATDKMRGDTSRGKTAMIDSVTQRYDLEEDRKYYEVVLDNGDMVWKLDTDAIDHETWDVVHQRGENEDPPEKLEAGMRVTYTGRAEFTRNGSYITGVEEFMQSTSGSDLTMDDWLATQGSGLLQGTVKKVTGQRLYLDNGAAYHISDKGDLIGLKFKNGKVEEVDISTTDISAGSTVYYGSTFGVGNIYVEVTD